MKQESITKLVTDVLAWWKEHEYDVVPVGDEDWDNQYDKPPFVITAWSLSSRIQANSITASGIRIAGIKLAEQVLLEWPKEVESQRGWAAYRLKDGDDREPTCMADGNEAFFISARDVLAQVPKPQQDESPQP
jgi:hypothetical protein